VTAFTKTQIDRLGDKLRSQVVSEQELKLLDDYRRTFSSAYDRVADKIRTAIGTPVSGRPAKSTTSIVEKLKRESIRLSQMQDIAGCRAIVADIGAQERAVESIRRDFPAATVLDRRRHPSHGYRAVHVVVREDDKPIEIQLRTPLQHVWAEMCEKFADIIDPAIKYGGGPPRVQASLSKLATVIEAMEALEGVVAGAGTAYNDTAEDLRRLRLKFAAALTTLVAEIPALDPEELT